MGRLAAFGSQRRQIAQLRARVQRLEDEVQEARRLNRRVAEIADVVQELLVPAADRDDERLKALLEDYRKTMGSGTV